jgi:hypothetical protein
MLRVVESSMLSEELAIMHKIRKLMCARSHTYRFN